MRNTFPGCAAVWERGEEDTEHEGEYQLNRSGLHPRCLPPHMAKPLHPTALGRGHRTLSPRLHGQAT